MSEPVQTSPERKKRSPWLWVGLGCGVIVLFALGVATVGGFFLAGKAKELVTDVKENPTAAAAEAIVRLNPELELVSSDRDAGTLTARETATGKEMTFSYKDIEEGRISFTNDEGETVHVDASKALSDAERPVVTVETGDGTTTMGVIGGEGLELPAWLPSYPGAKELPGGFASASEGRLSGSFAFATDDSAEQVLELYEAALAELGLEPRRSSAAGAGGSIHSLSVRDESYVFNLVVSPGESGGQAVHVTFQGPA